MLKYTKKACQITDKMFSSLIENFNFRTEKDIEKFLKHQSKKYKVKPSFSPFIVVSGKRSNQIHGKPTKNKLNGFTVIDFGVSYNGFKSDMTRTIYIGKPSKKELQDYNKLLKIQKKLISLIKPENYYCDLDIKARLLLGKDKIYFNHSLGHGVGKKIHEPPWLRSSSSDKIKSNDIITIEPGIYKKNYGIRIEDTILVKNKPVVLTKSNKKLICF
ncbi:M24 family metallopeptidase [Candidatus Woesearchaeota archaeon]|nr:M24 family metallopeptidase [Candidatus Woesearchaeota archaeon]